MSTLELPGGEVISFQLPGGSAPLHLTLLQGRAPLALLHPRDCTLHAYFITVQFHVSNCVTRSVVEHTVLDFYSYLLEL